MKQGGFSRDVKGKGEEERFSETSTTSCSSTHFPQSFGANACHPERSEGSGSTDEEILRCAQDDSQDTCMSYSHRNPGCFPPS